jgi:hypothetical protein
LQRVIRRFIYIIPKNYPFKTNNVKENEKIKKEADIVRAKTTRQSNAVIVLEKTAAFFLQAIFRHSCKKIYMRNI